MTDQSTTPRRMRRVNASEYLRQMHGLSFAPSTLAKMAVVGGGPAYRKAGNVPLYDPADLDAWAEAKLSKLVTSTSQLTRRVG